MSNRTAGVKEQIKQTQQKFDEEEHKMMDDDQVKIELNTRNRPIPSFPPSTPFHAEKRR